MRIRNPTGAAVVTEDDYSNLVPGEWRNDVDLREVEQPVAGASYTTVKARRLCEPCNFSSSALLELSHGEILWSLNLVKL